ncbi:MAG: hypothetical protein FWF81_11590 [Defluviitaleaceae bacterium]|nr:hypothetical protein [Defluviitaleaceae bacterium]
MDEQEKIYWHGAHFEALQLEFHEYLDALSFKKEYELSKEALRMDTLVIKKIKDVEIAKNIGKIFRNHNIVEYKSETDSFSLWDYNKVLGYAFIYSAFEKAQMSDITISISLTIFPRELIKTLESRGLTVQNSENGIHLITGDIVPIQILESKNLSEKENLFLRNLRSNLSGADMQKTLELYKKHEPLNDKNVYLDRIIRANLAAFKEATKMSETVREIFLETAEENGWLNDRYNDREIERAKKIAKKMLMLGYSPEKVTEATDLPFEMVISTASQLKQSAPAVR